MAAKSLKPSAKPLVTARWWRANAVYATGVTALTLLSAFSKAVNQFRFFIYPDSYYYLLIARNLLANHHPTGTLGPGGMPFPPPRYAAMKAMFPMLVAAVMAFGLPAEQTGHLVSGTAAVLAVPVAYAATWRLLRSKPAALAAAALVAVSYGLTYWAGFVMSDSVSVLLGFAVLALLARKRPDELSNPGDIASGVAAALLLLSRPTYFVALPLLVWMGFSAFRWTWKRTATAVVGCVLPVAAISAVWFPPPAFSAGILLRLLPVLAGAAVVALLATLAMRRRAVPSLRAFSSVREAPSRRVRPAWYAHSRQCPSPGADRGPGGFTASRGQLLPGPQSAVSASTAWSAQVASGLRGTTPAHVSPREIASTVELDTPKSAATRREDAPVRR